MGKAISALGSASGSAGSALGSAAGNVVSPVIVQAATKGTSSALGSTLGRAIGTGLSGLATGIGTSVSPQPTQQPATGSTAANENMVDAVTVTAPRLANTSTAPSSLGASLIPSVLGALSTSAPSSYAEAAPISQPTPLANTTESTEVSPIEVTAAMPGGQSGAGLGDALGAGLGDIISGEAGDENLYDSEPGSDDQLFDQDGEGIDPKDAGMLALLAGLGLKPKDLLGMGLLGAGLLTGAKKPDTATPGTPGGELTTIAQNNQALANMLSQRAQAGMSGQIGGMGMNAIKRMVRNAQAAIRQRYAGMGMSGSSAEAADLNAAAESGVDMQFRIGQQAAQSGLNAVAALTGQSANIYQALMNAQTQKDTALGNALANFAGAVGGRLLAG